MLVIFASRKKFGNPGVPWVDVVIRGSVDLFRIAVHCCSRGLKREVISYYEAITKFQEPGRV